MTRNLKEEISKLLIVLQDETTDCEGYNEKTQKNNCICGEVRQKAINAIISLIEADRKELVEALEWFVDDEPCSFDHHGYCQTHFTGTSPCINEMAKKLIKLANIEKERSDEGR